MYTATLNQTVSFKVQKKDYHSGGFLSTYRVKIDKGCQVSFAVEPKLKAPNNSLLPSLPCTPFVASANPQVVERGQATVFLAQGCQDDAGNKGTIKWTPSLPSNGVVEQTTTYSVTCDFAGQFLEQTLTLTVTEPVFKVSPSKSEILAGDPISLYASGCTSGYTGGQGTIKWSTGLTENAEKSKITVEPQKTITYTVSCDKAGKPTQTLYITVAVKEVGSYPVDPCDFVVATDIDLFNTSNPPSGNVKINIRGCIGGNLSWMTLSNNFENMASGGWKGTNTNTVVDANLPLTTTYRFRCQTTAGVCDKTITIPRTPRPNPVVISKDCRGYAANYAKEACISKVAVLASSNSGQSYNSKTNGLTLESTEGQNMLKLVDNECYNQGGISQWFYDAKRTSPLIPIGLYYQVPIPTRNTTYYSKCITNATDCLSSLTVTICPDEVGTIMEDTFLAQTEDSETSNLNCGFISTQKAIGSVLKSMICDNGKLVMAEPINADKLEVLKNSILQQPIFDGLSLPTISEEMVLEIIADKNRCSVAIDDLVKDIIGTSLKGDFNELATEPKMLNDVSNNLEQIKLEELLKDLKEHSTESNFEFKWANYFINSSQITSAFDYNGKSFEVYAKLGPDGSLDLRPTLEGIYQDFNVKVVLGNYCHTEYYLKIAYAGSDQTAIELKAKTYEDFEALVGKLGLTLTPSYKAKLTNKYKVEIQAAGNDCNKLDVIYENIPPYVIEALDKAELFAHLQIISACVISDNGGTCNTDEQKAILNIIKGINDKRYLFDNLQTNPNLVVQLYLKLSGESLNKYLSALLELSNEYWTDTEKNSNKHIILGNVPVGTNISPSSPYDICRGLNFIVGTSFSGGQLTFNNCCGRYNWLLFNVGSYENRKDINNFSSSVLEPVKVHYDGKEYAVTYPAIVAAHLAWQQNKGTLTESLLNNLNFLGLNSSLKIILTKGYGKFAKVLATITLSKDIIDIGLNGLSTEAKAKLQRDHPRFMAVWPYVSAGLDVATFSLEQLDDFLKNRKAVADILRKEGKTEAADKLDEMGEAAEQAAKTLEDRIRAKFGANADEFINELKLKPELTNALDALGDRADDFLAELAQSPVLKQRTLANADYVRAWKEYDPNKVYLINGRVPINSGPPLPKILNTPSGHPVTFDTNGFPDFRPYVLDNPAGGKYAFKIDMKGTYEGGDFLIADNLAGFSSINPRPAGYTWHHHQDGQTMMLVPDFINSPSKRGIPHSGGKSIIEHNNSNQVLYFTSPF